MIASKEELIEVLKNLPDEKKHDYEKDVVALAMKNLMMAEEDSRFSDWVNELINLPRQTSDLEEKVPFAAFCILVSWQRRNQNRSIELKLMKQYRDRFQRHPFYSHLYLLCLLDMDVVQRSKEILDLASHNVKVMPENAGAQHALAIAVADIFEATEFLPGLKPDEAWLERGEKAAQEAVDLDKNYAKFHCTKGRILALRGESEEALREIEIAIDKEDSNQQDYVLRINNYRIHLQRIRDVQRSKAVETRMQQQDADARILIQDMQKVLKAAEEKQASLEADTRASLIRNIEFLGLFAGIVSFTIGGINIAGGVSQQSMLGAAGLIIVLMGALLTVFAGFGIILHGYEENKGKRNVVVLGLGMILIAVGVALCCI